MFAVQTFAESAGSLIGCFAVVVVVGAVFVAVVWIKDDIEHRKRRRANDARKACYKYVLSVVENIVREHATTLVTKRRQKTYMDDYGVFVVDAWRAELVYFFRNVVDAQLLSRCSAPTLAEAMVQVLLDTPPHARIGDATACFEERMVCWIDALVIAIGEAMPEAVLDESTMSPTEYERFCADLLEQAGWNVRVCGRSGDQGVDIVAERDGIRAAFQCKLHNKPVGNSAVQEVYTGMKFHGAHRAAVISSADFTPGARVAAQQTGVMLMHHSHLVNFGKD